MDVLENGPYRPRRPILTRVALGLAVVVALAVALHEHQAAPAQAAPAQASAPAVDPLTVPAAAALPVVPGTQAVQALPVRGLASAGPVRLAPGEYTVNVACAAVRGSLIVQLSSGPASVSTRVVCTPVPVVTSTAIETDPGGLTVTVIADSATPAGFAWRARRS